MMLFAPEILKNSEKIILNFQGIPRTFIFWDFYICAPGSLALLIHSHALNFCSVFPTPLPETLRRGHNGRLHRGRALTVHSDEWGRVGGVAVRPLGRGFLGLSLALNACARRHDRSLLCMHPTNMPACDDAPTEPASVDACRHDALTEPLSCTPAVTPNMRYYPKETRRPHQG